MKAALIIPTYNGGELLKQCLKSISIQNVNLAQKIIIDSSSTDNTITSALEFGFEINIIDKSEFDHGGTRSKALELLHKDIDIVIFMTQDAILANEHAISELISAFNDELVDTVYGRQIPHNDANLFATHARYSSYKEKDYCTSIHDQNPNGFRKAFLSNSFAAYRLNKLEELGGFPSKLILGEDSFIAAKILLNNRKVAYRANAIVKHSHNYTILEEFRRYFDIGVFHQSQNWILQSLGAVEGEGIKFAVEQIRFLWHKKSYAQIFKSLVMSGMKFIGYKLGKNNIKFNRKVNIFFSMHKGYFR